MPMRSWSVQAEILTEAGAMVGWATGQLRRSGDGSWGGDLWAPLQSHTRRWPEGAIVLRIWPGKTRGRAILHPSIAERGDWPQPINTFTQTARFEGVGSSPLD